MDTIFEEIINALNKTTQEGGKTFESGKFVGLGWCFRQRKTSNFEGPYPLIALKVQKNAVHLYYPFWLFSSTEIQNFQEIFGQSAMGKSCIRVKKLSTERLNGIREIALRSCQH